jgi:hypothetical protein
LPKILIEMMEALIVKDHLHKMIVETDNVEILLQVEAFFESLIDQKDWYHWKTLLFAISS